jgi:hypothetical protein
VARRAQTSRRRRGRRGGARAEQSTRLIGRAHSARGMRVLSMRTGVEEAHRRHARAVLAAVEHAAAEWLHAVEADLGSLTRSLCSSTRRSARQSWLLFLHAEGTGRPVRLVLPCPDDRSRWRGGIQAEPRLQRVLFLQLWNRHACVLCVPSVCACSACLSVPCVCAAMRACSVELPVCARRAGASRGQQPVLSATEFLRPRCTPVRPRLPAAPHSSAALRCFLSGRPRL